jgi:HK97 gp10 family phage protein
MVQVHVNINEKWIEKVVREAISPGLKVLAEEVRARARRSTAFVDKTGHLRKSIRVTKPTSEDMQEAGETDVMVVRTRAPHAHLVEDGHAMVTSDGRVVGTVPPHPFLQPARDSVMSEAEAIVAHAMNKIDIAVGGGG